MALTLTLSFLVRVSYLEIYNECLRDLLAKEPKQNLEIKERPDFVFVKDLSNVSVAVLSNKRTAMKGV